MKIDGDKQCWQGGHFISFRHDYNVKEQRSGGGGEPKRELEVIC